MQVLKNFLKQLGEFLYALFFTRDDDLDVLQLLFAIIIIVTLAATWHAVTTGTVDAAVQIEALVTLRWLSALLVVTAVPKWLVPTIQDIVVKLPMKRENEEDEYDYGPRPSSRRWARD
jgi:hypothetical protein